MWGEGSAASAEYRNFVSVVITKQHGFVATTEPCFKEVQVAAKKNFVLRLDDEVYKALERWAADDFRSVNGQIEWLIDTALKKAGRKKENKDKDSAKSAE